MKNMDDKNRASHREARGFYARLYVLVFLMGYSIYYSI